MLLFFLFKTHELHSKKFVVRKFFFEHSSISEFSFCYSIECLYIPPVIFSNLGRYRSFKLISVSPYPLLCIFPIHKFLNCINIFLFALKMRISIYILLVEMDRYISCIFSFILFYKKIFLLQILVEILRSVIKIKLVVCADMFFAFKMLNIIQKYMFVLKIFSLMKYSHFFVKIKIS